MIKTFTTYEGVVTYRPYTKADILKRWDDNGCTFPLVFNSKKKAETYRIIGAGETDIILKHIGTGKLKELSYHELLDDYLFLGFNTICGKKV